MNEHQKYLLQEKLKHDKRQSILSNTGIEKNIYHMFIVIPDLIDANKKVFCPFCLGKYEMRRFLISTQHGLSRRFGKCPECENSMLLETLARMLKWTPVEYADFVYSYPRALFWSKVSKQFGKWKSRLWSLEMSEQFWLQYKKRKQQDAYSEYYPEEDD